MDMNHDERRRGDEKDRGIMPHFDIEIIGYLGAGLMVLTLGMRTMIPLRIVGIASSIVQIAFALLAGILPMLVQHSILLPMNIYRLYQQLRLVRKLKEAAAGDLSMAALIPHMSHRNVKTGEILFRKDDPADEMFIVESGRLRLLEIDIDVLPGTVVGELGLLAPNQQRTQTLECMEDGEVMQIGYDRIKALFFEDPSFGFYFLRLTSARLFQNISRLEGLLEARDAELALLKARRKKLNATLP
jgi:CRP/FNR family transcriptional regulator, cyclic AMP receptor protein